MSIRWTSWYVGIAACLVPGMGVNLLAASPMSVGALTARQQIKNKVVDALADGNISPHEQSDIFMKAETILEPQELEGLQRTLDRLQAQTNPSWSEEAAPMPPQRGRRYTDRYAGRESRISRVFHPMLYSGPTMGQRPVLSDQYVRREPRPSRVFHPMSYSEPPRDQHSVVSDQYAWREPRSSRVFRPMPYSRPPREQRPLLSSRLGRVGQRLPYIERPTWNRNRVRQLVAGLPRTNAVYPGRPTLLSSRNPREYTVVRTLPAPAPTPQVRQAGVPPKWFPAKRSSPPRPNTRKLYSAEELPGVETPVASAPLPDEDLYSSSPARSTAERTSYRSKPDYRTSRTAYLELLRNR